MIFCTAIMLVAKIISFDWNVSNYYRASISRWWNTILTLPSLLEIRLAIKVSIILNYSLNNWNSHVKRKDFLPSSKIDEISFQLSFFMKNYPFMVMQIRLALRVVSCNNRIIFLNVRCKYFMLILKLYSYESTLGKCNISRLIFSKLINLISTDYHAKYEVVLIPCYIIELTVRNL